MTPVDEIKARLRALATLDEKLDYLTQECLDGDAETVRVTESFRWVLCKNHRNPKAKDLARLLGAKEARHAANQNPGDAVSHKDRRPN